MNQPPTGASIVPRKPLQSGWMTKLGAIRKNWKSRFFELHHDVITYSEGSRSNGIKGKIFTKDIIAIVEPKDGLFKGKANVFGISTPNRVYYVSSQTRIQAMEWMDAIMKISPDIKLQPAHTTVRQSKNEAKPRSASINIPQTQPRQSKIASENNNNNSSASLPKQNTGISSVPISAHTSVDLPGLDDDEEDSIKESSFDLLPLDKYLGMLIKVNNQVGQQNPLIRLRKDQLLESTLKQASIDLNCWKESDHYWKSLFKSKSTDFVNHTNLIIDYAKAYITYYEKQKDVLSNMHRQICGVASFLLDVTEQPNYFTRDATPTEIGTWKLIEVPQVDTFDKWIAVNTAFEYWSPRGNTSEDIFTKLNLTLNSVDWAVISFYWSLAMQSRFNPTIYLDYIQQYKALRPRYWNVYSSDDSDDSVMADVAMLSKSL